jgi:hypothetical protein
MRARVSLLLIALYSTKIIGSIVERNPSNSTNNKKNNLIFNNKNICSPPIEQIDINKCKVELYSIIDIVIALIFM